MSMLATSDPVQQLTTEETKRQPRLWKQTGSGFFGVAQAFNFAGVTFTCNGEYETYRRMNRDPTLALARAMAKLPIIGATHSFEADDDVPDEVLATVQKSVDAIWPEIIETLLWSLEYGWKSAEVVWDWDDGPLVPVRIKPLQVDITVILVDPDTGSMLGVRQREVDLREGKYIYYGNEVEDQNYYGTSRHENIRELVYGPWRDTMKKLGEYLAKAAGVTPVVRYPIGQGTDAAGANDDNLKRAQAIIQGLSQNIGMCFPYEIPAALEEGVRNGTLTMKDACAWMVDFLETKSDHSGGMINSARYLDSLKMRGWLVPERAGIEGQMGTKAEAEAHGDVGIGTAEQTHTGICRAVTRQLVDPMLAYNWGPEMRGKVRIVPAPLQDDARTLVRDIVKSVLTNPSALDVLLSTSDWDAMMDIAGVPKGQEIVDPASLVGDGQGGDQPTPAPKPLNATEQQVKAARILARVHAALTGKRRPLKLTAGPHKWACVYARLPEAESAEILKLGREIPDDQLTGDGRETEPHIALKYGIAPDSVEAVRGVLEALPPIKVVLGTTSVFGNPQQDVLVVDCYGEGLRLANDALDKAVPHIDTFDWYQPHATVAYLKPGAGQLYAGSKALEGREIVVDRVVFSDRAGRKSEVMLMGPAAAPASGSATP